MDEFPILPYYVIVRLHFSKFVTNVKNKQEHGRESLSLFICNTCIDDIMRSSNSFTFIVLVEQATA